MNLLYQSPVGIIRITETDGLVSAVSFRDGLEEDIVIASTPALELAHQQLAEYFAGKRLDFDFPFNQQGTTFQQAVWDELVRIGYGKTISYAQQSQRMASPLAIRAIASANGKNNIAIVVPCHRVIGSDGSLTGYAGGMWRKKWLLDHEARVLGIGQISMF